jgi:hypothetical protein
MAVAPLSNTKLTSAPCAISHAAVEASLAEASGVMYSVEKFDRFTIPVSSAIIRLMEVVSPVLAALMIGGNPPQPVSIRRKAKRSESVSVVDFMDMSVDLRKISENFVSSQLKL